MVHERAQAGPLFAPRTRAGSAVARRRFEVHGLALTQQRLSASAHHDPQPSAGVAGVVQLQREARQQTLHVTVFQRLAEPDALQRRRAEKLSVWWPHAVRQERARAALTLAADRADPAELLALREAVAAAPDDHQARFDLAVAEMAEGNRDAAADALLFIIAADKDWNEGAARAKLLSIFETIGITDPWVAATRRRLSAALFG